MVVLAELAIHCRAAVAAVSLEIGFHLAGRDIENPHVTAGLGRRAVGAAATEENGRVGDDRETMRMTPCEFVKLDELAVFGIGLRQQSRLCGHDSEGVGLPWMHRGVCAGVRIWSLAHPDKIRTRDLSFQSAASLQQRLRPMRPSASPHREQEIVALNSKANVRYSRNKKQETLEVRVGTSRWKFQAGCSDITISTNLCRLLTLSGLS